MNKNQLGYQVGRVLYGGTDVIYLTIATRMGFKGVHSFANSQTPQGLFYGLVFAVCLLQGLRYAAARRLLHLGSRQISAHPEQYPLEHAEKVIIEDSGGLELLLSRTWQRETKEWGTMLKAYPEKGKAVVYKILNPLESKRLGLIQNERRASLTIDLEKVEKGRYNGMHHYHPDVSQFHPLGLVGATDFTIGFVDRFKLLNWINLLTFNLSGGPEIVGFNRNYTYIPKDQSKRELVKATPRQIMRYLGSLR